VKKYISSYGFNCLLFATILLFAGCATSRKAERVAKATQEAKEKAIKEKYADKLGVPADSVSNYPLYSFVDDWYGTPYKYAGRTKSGVDCSDFICILLQTIYSKSLSGTAGNIFEACRPISADSLKEGDLVFFKINSKIISHVGFYLQNNRFVHASVHSGVVISDLGQDYYKKYFFKAGRLKT
jgi:lipoprotein Spr